MIVKKGTWNIVLAGLWNQAVFTPEWVGRRLFHNKEVEALISIMPRMPLIYRNENVAIEVAPERLVVRPRRINDTCLLAAEGTAHEALRALQDTPLMGVGVNFAFTESEPHRDLVALFDIADRLSLTEEGWETEERRLVRRLRHEGDVLNLTLAWNGRDMDVEFNYHTETAENAVALASVTGRILELREAALRVLEQTYALRIELKDDDNG